MLRIIITSRLWEISAAAVLGWREDRVSPWLGRATSSESVVHHLAQDPREPTITKPYRQINHSRSKRTSKQWADHAFQFVRRGQGCGAGDEVEFGSALNVLVASVLQRSTWRTRDVMPTGARSHLHTYTLFSISSVEAPSNGTTRVRTKQKIIAQEYLCEQRGLNPGFGHPAYLNYPMQHGA